MKTKIKSIKQYDGVNLLFVDYKSGARRVVGLGESYYNLTKTQADFMKAATRKEIKIPALFEADGMKTNYVWELA